MNMSIGRKVVYPSQGPCLIGAVVDKDIGGCATSFYRLQLLDDHGGELFVPVDKAQKIGIRPLLKRSDIPVLLQQLMNVVQVNLDWKQRAHENMKLINSGSAYDLARVVESLTGLSKRKVLSFRENQLLEKARRLLICEISEVIGKSRSIAEEQVDQALKAQK